MLTPLKQTLRRLRQHEPGERFAAFHREQAHQPFWVKALFFGLAFVSLAVGVVLAFIPGPAVLFFALAGALFSTQSGFVARTLDRGEVWGRRAFARFRASRRRRKARRSQAHTSGPAGSSARGAR
jgi:hypothetical protein